MICMYIRDTNMAYIHTLKYFLNMLFLVAALTERLFKCIILDVSPQFSNFIFFIHSIFKKYIVECTICVAKTRALTAYCEADLSLCFRLCNCWFSHVVAQIIFSIYVPR